jgi:hypothetical protein
MTRITGGTGVAHPGPVSKGSEPEQANADVYIIPTSAPPRRPSNPGSQPPRDVNLPPGRQAILGMLETSSSRWFEPKASIDDIKPGDKAKVAEMFAKVREQLDTGLVIVGERHTQQHARAVIMEAIDQGKVDQLFLELASAHADPEGNVSEEPSPFTRRLSVDLRASAGTSIENNARLQAAVSKVSEGSHRNSISIAQLIGHAVAKGVHVHFADNAPRDGDQIGPAALARRNESMAACIRNNVGSATGRAIVLTGASHTMASETQAGFTLQSLCGIDDCRVHDFNKAFPEGKA